MGNYIIRKKDQLDLKETCRIFAFWLYHLSYLLLADKKKTWALMPVNNKQTVKNILF